MKPLYSYDSIIKIIYTGWSQLILYIISLIRYIVCFFTALFCFLPALLISSIGEHDTLKTNRFLFFLLHMSYRGIIWGMVSKLKIKGDLHTFDIPAIIIANHQSSLDIPVLGLLLNGKPHQWYALDRFFKTPILGFFLRKMCVKVNQSSSMECTKELIRGLKCVRKQKRSVIIFPEGGRWVDGKIHDFFSGFAIIAKRTGMPVIPVYLKNFGKVYPPHSFLVYPEETEVTIGEPIYYQKDENFRLFSEKVKEWFLKQV